VGGDSAKIKMGNHWEKRNQWDGTDQMKWERKYKE